MKILSALLEITPNLATRAVTPPRRGLDEIRVRRRDFIEHLKPIFTTLERVEDSLSYPTAAAYTDIDSDAVITGTGDHTTGTGGSTTGTGYYTAGTAGTRWRTCTARAAKGGW
ncbi:hypothetical protein Tco_0078104 [Tanacetum coccineum]